MSRPATRRVVNGCAPALRKPDAIPSNLRHLIQLNTTFRVLICPDARCRKAVQPRAFVEHLRVQHHTGLNERQKVAEYVEGFETDYDYTSIQLPADGCSPQPELPVMDGFQCRQCPFKSSNSKRMRTHGIQEHNKKRASNEELYCKIRMQSWFQDHRQRYWAVKENRTSDPVDTTSRDGYRTSKHRRNIISSSEDEDENSDDNVREMSSGSGYEREEAAVNEVIIVNPSIRGTQTTREVISIDQERGEIVDAYVGDGEYEDDDWDDEEEDPDWKEDIVDEQSSVVTEAQQFVTSSSPFTDVFSPCPRKDGSREIRNEIQVSEEEMVESIELESLYDSDDSDVCLFPASRKRKRMTEASERIVRQRVIGKGRFNDSGVIMESDIQSHEMEQVSRIDAIIHSSGSKSIDDPGNVVVQSSQVGVINVPSSPPMLLSPQRKDDIHEHDMHMERDDDSVPVPRKEAEWKDVGTQTEPFASHATHGKMLPWDRMSTGDVYNDERARSNVYWPGLKGFMDWWSQGCPLCQIRGRSKIKHPIEECSRNGARNIVEMARDMDRGMPHHRSCCRFCRGPRESL
jgi:hypothetical protein